MRNLHKWLKKRVLIEGIVKEINENSFLFTDIAVRLYGDDIANAEQIDHLWIFLPSESISDQQQLSPVIVGECRCVLGDIFQYTRKNGSIDYGVKPINFWHLSSLLKKNLDLAEKDPYKAKELLVFILQKLKNRELFYPTDNSFRGTEKLILSWIKGVESRIEDEEITSRKRSESLMHKKGSITKDPVSFKTKKKQQDQEKKGFGR